MITKAEILEIQNNKYLVHIPLFNFAGDIKPFTEWATLCYQPGNLESYLVHDKVFVDFENNDIGKPVIIGKLYLGPEKEKRTEFSGMNLKIENSAQLPIDISVGDFDKEHIYKILNSHDSILDRLDKLEKLLLTNLNNTSDHND